MSTPKRADTRAERAQAEAVVPTRAQRLAVILRYLRGDAADPTDDHGNAQPPWRYLTHTDGELELQVDSADGDRVVGRGATHEAALAALETKVLKSAAEETVNV